MVRRVRKGRELETREWSMILSAALIKIGLGFLEHD